MDPITAGLNLATEVVKLITLIIETTPPEVRAKQAERADRALERILDFIDRLQPKP